MTIRDFREDGTLGFLDHLSRSAANIVRLDISITPYPARPLSALLYTKVISTFRGLQSLHLAHPPIEDDEQRRLAMNTLRTLQDMEEFGFRGEMMMVSLCISLPSTFRVWKMNVFCDFRTIVEIW
jgi:hypothetical protein